MPGASLASDSQQDALSLAIKTRDGRDSTAFLCHNSADKEVVKSIADALEIEFGRKFFLDVFSIPVGAEFIPWIAKAIEGCDACAIFLGGAGWGPTHFWEAELALSRYRRDPKLKIIPVALPGLSMEEARKLGSGNLFQEVNWADFTKGPGDRLSLEKLEGAISGTVVAGDRGPAQLTPYQIRRDAERWAKSKQKDFSILYGGRQLAEAEAMMRDNTDVVVVAGVKRFLDASRERQSAVWRRFAMGAIVASLVLLAISVIALVNYELAERRRLVSASRQLALMARQAAGADRALLMAAHAVFISETPEARGAALEQLQEFRFLKRMIRSGASVEAAALAKGAVLLIGTSDGLRRLPRDAAETLPREEASREAVTAVLALGDKIWLGRQDGRVDEVVGSDQRILARGPAGVPPGRDTRVRTLVHDTTGELIAIGTGAGRIAIVHLADGIVAGEFDEGDLIRINSLAFDPKRPRLAAGTSDGVIEVIDTSTMHVLQRYPHIEGGVLALGYVADGSLVAVSGYGRMHYFDGRNNELQSPIVGDIAPLATAVAIDYRRSRVAVGDSSGSVWLYDAATGKGTGAEPLRAHSDTVTAIVFGATADELYSAAANGSVAVWDLAGRQGPGVDLPQLNPSPSQIRVDGTGAIVAGVADGGHGEIRRLVSNQWEQATDLEKAARRLDGSGFLFREPRRSADGFEEVTSVVSGIALDEAGSHVAFVTSGGAVLHLALDKPEAAPLILSAASPSAPSDIAISGDGETVVTVDEDGKRVATYRIYGDRVARAVVFPPVAARMAALSRVGDQMAIGLTEGSVALYRLRKGVWKAVRPPWPAQKSEVAGLTFSRDDRTLASYGSGGGGADKTIALSPLIGIPDVRVLQARQAYGSVSAFSMGASSGVLAAGDASGEVLLWSATDAGATGRFRSGSSYVSAAFVDEVRSRLLTANGDGGIFALELEPLNLAAMACAKANRPLSPDEWREVLPDDPYFDYCGAKGR